MEKALQIIFGLLLAIIIVFILGYYFYNTAKHLNEEKTTDKNYNKIFSSLFSSVLFFNRKNRKGVGWALKIIFVILLSVGIILLYYKYIHSEVQKGEKSIDRISSGVPDLNKKVECNKKCSIYEGDNYEECYSLCVKE